MARSVAFCYFETVSIELLFKGKVTCNLPGGDSMKFSPSVKETHLNEGTAAPQFVLPDQHGRRHSLQDYRGRRVILYFYGRDDTPG